MPAKTTAARGKTQLNFYLRTWGSADEALRALRAMKGLDDEIELLRSRLRDRVKRAPEAIDELLPAIKLILHAVAIRHRITGPAREALYENVAAVLASVGSDLLPEDDAATDAAGQPETSVAVEAGV